MFYLVCYDVVNDRRRTKVANLLKGYGLRVQKSVFECVLNSDQLTMIQTKAAKILDEKTDQIRFYPLSAHCRRKVLIVGFQPLHQVDDVAFIV